MTPAALVGGLVVRRLEPFTARYAELPCPRGRCHEKMVTWNATFAGAKGDCLGQAIRSDPVIGPSVTTQKLHVPA